MLGAQGTDIVMGKMWDDNHISHTTTLVLLNIVDNLAVFVIHPCPSIISWIQQAFQQLHLDQASSMLNHFTVIVTPPLDTSQNIRIAAMGNICHERSTCRYYYVVIELIREGSMIKFIDFDTGALLVHHLDLGIEAIGQLPAMGQGIWLPGSQQILQQFPGTRCYLGDGSIERSQLKGILTEDFLGLGLGAIESNMFREGR